MPLFQGFVYNDAGAVVVGAAVEVYDRNTTTPSRGSDTTDANGFFSITVATQGRYDVEVTSGSSVRRIKYDDARQLEELDVGVLRLRDSSDDSHTLTLTTGNLTSNDTLDLSTIGNITRYWQLQPFGDSTPVDTGDGAARLDIPADVAGFNLTEVRAKVTTAGTTGTVTIQIRNETQGADMLSTRLTIDSGEISSKTAAVPAVIDTANDDVADDDTLRIDIDATQTTRPQGLRVTLGFASA